MESSQVGKFKGDLTHRCLTTASPLPHHCLTAASPLPHLGTPWHTVCLTLCGCVSTVVCMPLSFITISPSVSFAPTNIRFPCYHLNCPSKMIPVLVTVLDDNTVTMTVLDNNNHVNCDGYLHDSKTATITLPVFWFR